VLDSHSSTLVATSGYAFGSNFTFLQKVQTAVFMALLLIGSVVLAFLLSRKVPGIALMALGSCYVSDTIVWLYHLAHPPSYPATEKQVQFFHLSRSVTGLRRRLDHCCCSNRARALGALSIPVVVCPI
jgi:hypothetical protein